VIPENIAQLTIFQAGFFSGMGFGAIIGFALGYKLRGSTDTSLPDPK
jgi:uncharacterized membrane protein (Fun14 family)